MPKAQPDKIAISSPSDLKHEGDALQAVLALNETEDTWEKINRSLKRFQAVVRGGATKLTDDCVALLKDPRTAKGLVRSIITERGALSGTALELVASCTRLGPQFAPLLPIYLPPILRLFGRPNKVYTARASATVASIVKNTHLAEVLRYIVLEWRSEAGKSASFREHAAATVAVLLGTDTGVLAVDKDGLTRRIDELEWVIKTGATGREPSVRSDMKKCWEVYKREWPERVHAFTAPMSPTTRKYLKVDSLGSSMSAAASAPVSTSSSAAVPPRRPAAATALSASTSSSTHHHAGPSTHAYSNASTAHSGRAAPGLTRSHGPSTSRTAHATQHHAPPLPPTSHSGPLAGTSASTMSAAGPSLGMGPPPLRTGSRGQAESTHVRSVSGSTASSSRSVSRSDLRDGASGGGGDDALTSSIRATGSATATSTGQTGRAGFKPTAARPVLASSGSSRPAGRALTTVASNVASSGTSASTGGGQAAAPEPRKARRVPVQAPAAAPSAAAVPPSSAALTTSATASTSLAPPVPSVSSASAGSSSAAVPALARSHNSTSSLAKSHGSTSASSITVKATSAPVPSLPISAAATPAAAGPAPASEAVATAAPVPPSVPAAAAAAVALSAPGHAPFRPTRRPVTAATTTTASTASRARPGVAPSAATLASRERRAAREKERERKAAEEKAKRVAEEEKAEARRRDREKELKEIGEKASKVPLPPVDLDEGVVEEEVPVPVRSETVEPAVEAPAPSTVEQDDEAAPVVGELEAAANGEVSTATASAASSVQELQPTSLQEVEPAVAKPLVEIAEPAAPAPPSVVAEQSQPNLPLESPAGEALENGRDKPEEPESVAVATAGPEDAAFTSVPDQHDLVEESVGMDSDYLVESQGTDQAEEEPQEESTIILQVGPSQALSEGTQIAEAPLDDDAVPTQAYKDELFEPRAGEREDRDEAADDSVEVDEAVPPLPHPPMERTSQHDDVNSALVEPHVDNNCLTEPVEAGSGSASEAQEDDKPDAALARPVFPLSPERHSDEPMDVSGEDDNVDEHPSLVLDASPARLPPATSPAASPLHRTHPSAQSALSTPVRHDSRPFAHYPTPSPGPVSRHDAPFTPVSAVPVRFPLATMPYSPEPFQTRSIILDTPPRFEAYAAIRLPRRPAEGTKSNESAALGASALEDEDPVHNSPHPAAIDSGAVPEAKFETSARQEQVSPPRQPIFLPGPEEALDRDANPTFDDDSFVGVRSGRGEPTDTRVRAAISEDRSEQLEYSMPPRGEPSSCSTEDSDDPAAQHDYDISASVDASSVGQEADETMQEVPAMSAALDASSPLASATPVKSAGTDFVEAGPEIEDDEEEDFGAPGSPAGTTLDFSDFDAPPSTSTPSGRERRPLWDESLLGDESANFELEQPGLRFHDETQSEHSLASTVLGDFDVSGTGPTQFASALPDRREHVEAEPPVLQRSLRSRVVTVDLSASTSKTPARSTRAATASAQRSALTEVQR